MAAKVKFGIGDRLELTHVKSAIGGKVSDSKYASQVLDFDGFKTVKIAMPISEGRVVPLEINDQYELCFFTAGGLYQCKGQIRKRYSENNMFMLDVLLLTELKKYQRRKYYRLDCMFPIRYRVVSEVELMLLEKLKNDRFSSPEEKANCEEAVEQFTKDWKEGTISDLSGGGVRFHGKDPIEKELTIQVMLPLSFSSGIVPMSFLMKVIACVHSEQSKLAYEIKGEFSNVKDSEREVIIKYVFEEQRRRMRKE